MPLALLDFSAVIGVGWWVANGHLQASENLFSQLVHAELVLGRAVLGVLRRLVDALLGVILRRPERAAAAATYSIGHLLHY